jgi:hypothetical protein
MAQTTFVSKDSEAGMLFGSRSGLASILLIFLHWEAEGEFFWEGKVHGECLRGTLRPASDLD